MFKWLYRLGMLMLSLVLITGCNDKIVYSIIPEIAMSDRQVYQSPTDIIIAFTDGDGDIGLNQGDTIPPFDCVPDSTNPDFCTNLKHFNLFFYYFTNVDGVWEETDLALQIFYRVPLVTPRGQNKALKGEIEIAFPIEPSIADSFRFEIELIDRAFHVSNRITTRTIFK